MGGMKAAVERLAPTPARGVTMQIPLTQCNLRIFKTLFCCVHGSGSFAVGWLGLLRDAPAFLCNVLIT